MDNTVPTGEPDKMECCRCGVPLVLKRADFSYLNYNFHVDVPRCPVCGMIFLPQDLVEGKMAEVEAVLEEK